MTLAVGQHKHEWTDFDTSETACAICGVSAEPVLLRDTPEDVDDFRGIMVEHGWTHDGMRCGAKCGDAIIAALRGRNAGFYDDPNAEGNDR